MNRLIIVESPTKARTISQYLGGEYRVLSSQGHVRDLPTNELGVDIAGGFEPQFESVAKKAKLLTELRKAARESERIFLATDHDREGEAIAYDLYEILRRVVKDDDAFSRPVFNEITKSAILAALKKPESINLDRVEAQRTRRVLDRLVGYLVSPLLSRAVARSRFAGLSAGRVQSVALRFLCDREREIAHFVPEEYWEIEARLENGEPFTARVTHKDGEKLLVRSEAEARAVESALQGATLRVESVEERDRQRQPAPPLITSSLQQTASSALGFSPKRTMAVAQELYEGIGLPEGSEGLITYMRTDSVRVADEAVAAARQAIASSYGDAYLSERPRSFKNRRTSQDAHEAIRPTDVARTPESVATYLTPDQMKLYGLIYGRFLATQMSQAVYRQRSVAIAAGSFTLEASGSELTFDGFLRALPERREKEGSIPPKLRKGQKLAISEVLTKQKHTEPPRRYSEAGLVNLLEKEGIGRPSTYASIVSVIQERGYAVKEGSSIRPTLLGQMVVDFLAQHFAETVEPQFTARLEEDLDRIEEGEITRREVLDEFYGPLSSRLDALQGAMERGAEKVFRVPTDVSCPQCGAPMELLYWKGGHFLGCSRYPDCEGRVSVPPQVAAVYGGEQVLLRAELEKAAETAVASQTCPECGGPMELRSGRYGRYARCMNPDCKTTAPVSTGVVCPACGQGILVEKYAAKRRRTFYSCSRYPACRFATSERPIKPCPVCGQGVLVQKGDELRCSTQGCTHREAAEPGAEAATPPPTEA
ncbi:MAG: type I DNA topoisomerase [Candidatus Bipolaricaulota bacterium]